MSAILIRQEHVRVLLAVRGNFDSFPTGGVVCKEEGVSFGLGETQFKATWAFGAAIGLSHTAVLSNQIRGVLALGLGLNQCVSHPAMLSLLV